DSTYQRCSLAAHTWLPRQAITAPTSPAACSADLALLNQPVERTVSRATGHAAHAFDHIVDMDLLSEVLHDIHHFRLYVEPIVGVPRVVLLYLSLARPCHGALDGRPRVGDRFLQLLLAELGLGWS